MTLQKNSVLLLLNFFLIMALKCKFHPKHMMYKCVIYSLSILFECVFRLFVFGKSFKLPEVKGHVSTFSQNNDSFMKYAFTGL